MKKTLVASAVAASLVTTPTMAADPEQQGAGDLFSQLSEQLEGMPEIYGNVQIIYTNADHESFEGSQSQLTDYAYSTLGVQHSHEIMPGVEAFGKLELEGFFVTEDTISEAIVVDEAYLGVRGGFGEVWVGSDDSQYEVLIGDYGNWYYEVAQSNFFSNWSTGEDDLVQYVSPSFGGLTLHGVVQIDAKNERAVDNQDDQNNQSKYPYQLGVRYKMDRLSVALAMDSNDGAANNENTYGVRVDFAVNDSLSLNTFYSTQKGDRAVAAANEEFGADPVESFESYGTVAENIGLGEDLIGVQGIYLMGATRFSLSYAMEEDDVDGAGDGKRESTNITAQVLHSLSEHLYVYVEGLRRNDEEGSAYDADYNAVNVGGAYLF
ncbi:MAG: porin [Maritimibacter sp.]|nr:porin [Maritimibacter sp.]|tara:strand:+ start:6505 stop:7638 length:1134 start_codon:yes stop_codon:yes gene_type:complete